jgi:hypothetical protein
MVDWFAASKTAVERTHFYWGQQRSEALASHNTIVMELARSHSWSVAIEYDIQQREAVARNPAHDLSILDTSALTVIATRMALLAPPPPVMHQGAAPHPTPYKRPNSVEHQEYQLRKRAKPDHPMCFRCGLAGHLPADCKANQTTAGKPTAAIGQNTRNEHALLAPSGKQYCFNWAKSSTCRWGASCYNTHACSLCGDATHGAGSCKPQY